MRVRLLGEDLVAFRDSEGRVGLVDAYCPHRRAPMYFGRNEPSGLRCAYHGWKFARNGDCIDIGSEPCDSPLRTEVKIKSYPTWEGGDLVWTYMGPLATLPAFPDYEWLRVPSTHYRVSKTFEDCNYLQALEGGLDTSHSSFTHNERLGDKNWIRNRDGAPQLEVNPTNYGFQYVSTRNMGVDGKYVRVLHYLMPAQQMRGGVTSWTGIEKADVPRLDGHIWVPIDDEHTWTFNMIWSYDESVAITDDWYSDDEARFGRGRDDLEAGFRLKRNVSNDYMIDRQMQKTKNFTGIVGINTQDFALQEGMGHIVDRSKEHLGTSDAAGIAVRRFLSEGSLLVQKGESPRGLDPATHRMVRPYDAVVQDGNAWEADFAAELIAKW